MDRATGIGKWKFDVGFQARRKNNVMMETL